MPRHLRPSPGQPPASGQIETLASSRTVAGIVVLLSILSALVGCSGNADATSAVASDAAPLTDAEDSSPPSEAGDAAEAGPPDDAGSPGDASTDSSDASTGSTLVDAAPEASFQEAPHGTATVPNNGGPVFANPTLVTITFAGDSERAFAEKLGAYLVKSPWLGAVGPEYGIGLGTHVPIELSQTAPGTIDDTTIQALIASLIIDGTVPSPAGGSVIPVTSGSPFDDGGTPDAGSLDDGGDAGEDAASPVAVLLPAIYMIYIPTTTTETIDGSTLCESSGGGYHAQAQGSFNGETFAYAVVSQCPGAQLTDLETAVSHEFIEASTDPSQTAPAWALLDPYSVWYNFGGEVGDLCSFVNPQWNEGGYTALQRVYSNASANSGGDPCIPAVDTYYAVDAEPQYVVTVNAGSSATFTLSGWSTAAVSDWSLAASPYISNPPTFAPPYSLTSSTLNNGQEAKLTVTVPAGTASQSYALLLVGSELSELSYNYSLVEVYVP